jgi:hypothetical protein
MGQIRNLVPAIRKAQSGDPEAMKELMKNFDPLIVNNASYGRNHMDQDEYQNLRLLVFIMIQAFDLDLYLNGGNH